MNTAYYALLEKYDRQVPRYTSYPPATRFRPPAETEHGLHADGLSAADKDISLYIHIPFCARLCHYCGCHMRVVNSHEPVKAYIDSLEQEVALIAALLPSDSRVRFLHFGGGSPTMLRPADFRRIMKALRESFSFDSPEISLEADPRNLTEPRVAAYAAEGVTRLSLGVQDLNDDVLEAINRPQPFRVVYNAVRLCRAYGINRLNFDLMYGLPYQTVEHIRRTMELSMALAPDRMSYFGYAHVPWMKKHMALLEDRALPQRHDRYVLQQEGSQCLERGGYAPVGIDHYCKAGDSLLQASRNKTMRRNFQGYTTDTAPSLIGLGASSISFVGKAYHQNELSVRVYQQHISEGKLPTGRILPLLPEDWPVRDIIESLMCTLEVDLAGIIKKYGLQPSAFHENLFRLRPMIDDGILDISNFVIKIHPEYRVLTRLVCEAFDAYAARSPAVHGDEKNQRRHALAV